MKLLINSALLFGATALVSSAISLSASQQVLQDGSSWNEERSSPDPLTPDQQKLIQSLEKHYGSSMPDDIKQIWANFTDDTPGFYESFMVKSKAQNVRRSPDSAWDFIMRGNMPPQQHRFSKPQDQSQLNYNWKPHDQKIIDYSLRTKVVVNPKRLGIDKVKQYSGYLDDDANDKHFFFWFFESRNDVEKDPVILWLNGGPGCSSMTGLFMELGPSVVTSDGLKYNPSSWNSNASVIFLDQPVNTGFSYSSSEVSDSVASAKDVYALLTLFFRQFPQYAHQDFHIAGESYAGHYIPVTAAEILSHKDRNINLKSIMIGNGLTNPLVQYDYYRPMACGEGGYPAVLSPRACQSMESSMPSCTDMIKTCYAQDFRWQCITATIHCNRVSMNAYAQTGQNVYDIRSKCVDQEHLCYPQMGWIEKFLNRQSVKKSLGTEVGNFATCNMNINRRFLFQGDWMKPYHRKIPNILKEIPVLIYAGDADYICNWLGNLAWANELEWEGHESFASAKLKALTMAGGSKKYGEIKSAKNLTFIRLYGAGHMVPFNQPEASLDMVNRWVNWEWTA